MKNSVRYFVKKKSMVLSSLSLPLPFANNPIINCSRVVVKLNYNCISIVQKGELYARKNVNFE